MLPYSVFYIPGVPVVRCCESRVPPCIVGRSCIALESFHWLRGWKVVLVRCDSEVRSRSAFVVMFPLSVAVVFRQFCWVT